MLKNEHGIFTDITNREGNIVQTEEEVYKDFLLGKNTNKTDNYPKEKTNQEIIEELNQQWDTINFLLKNGGFVPKESEE